jgi:hypothetical protein
MRVSSICCLNMNVDLTLSQFETNINNRNFKTNTDGNRDNLKCECQAHVA